MSRNVRSLLLLSALLSIALFLVGFRYGKYVEHMDKLYVPPTPTLIPVTLQPTEKPFAVNMYGTKVCGVSFLMPNYLEEKLISTEEAILSKKSESIYISCNKKVIEAAKMERKNASPSASLIVLNQKTPVFDNGHNSSIIVYNNQTKQSVLLETTWILVKLVFPSLELSK